MRRISWRLPALLLTVFVVAGLTFACGDDDDDDAAAEPTTTEAAEPSPTEEATPVALDPGVTDTEIIIGAHAALSGPLAIAAAVHEAVGVYFDYINDTEGGVNGRTIVYEVRDNQWPNAAQAKIVTQQLVEQVGVFAMLGNLGTVTHLAAVDYLDEQGVPDFGVISGATVFVDPVRRYTFAGLPSYVTEGQTMATYVNDNLPAARAGILFENDDLGRGYIEGFEEAFNGEIVRQEAYEAAETDTSSQVASLLDAGADVIILACTAQPCASAIRSARDAGSDVQFIMSGTNAISIMFLLVGGPANLDGTIVNAYLKDICQTDDPAVQRHIEIMEAAGLTPSYFTIGGQVLAELFIENLKLAGDPPTREGLIAAAESTTGLVIGLLPGPVSTSPTDHRPLETFQIARADGATGCFVPIGDPVSFESTTQ